MDRSGRALWLEEGGKRKSENKGAGVWVASGLGLGLLTGSETDYLEVDTSDVQDGSN